MGALSARFFGYVQDADFYRDLHREAVALLPPGAGKTWFDMGCGPGLVARLAHDRGYDAVGFDLDPHMVGLARRRSARAAGPRYVESGLDDLVARHGRA
ncbi:MAG TPA: methyltransferase domain-containing protein, partial [Burkholderiaceae bacterium]